MDALLRPGARMSLGAVRALHANGSVGLRSRNQMILSAYQTVGLGLGYYRKTLNQLRTHSANQKPPSDSDFDIEKSPFAHLLKKPASTSLDNIVSSMSTSPAYTSTPPSDITTTTDTTIPLDNTTESSTSSSSPSPTSSSASAPTAKTAEPLSGPKDATSPNTINTRDLHKNIQETRKALQERFSVFMDNVQNRIVHASETLNILTGYTPIEKIKNSNAELEASLADAQNRVRSTRSHYKTMHARRAATQREVTTLLARKDVWTPADLERFTQLYRTDHEMESQVTEASERLTEAEAEEQTLNTKLNQGILRRYHEEQVWSDRIRRASTWGTWGLMGVNILLFLVFQFIAEPWKRNRLVKGVVEEEKAVLEEVRERLDHVMKTMEDNLAKAHALAQPPPAPPVPEVAEGLPPVQPEEENLQLLPSEQMEEPAPRTLSQAYTTKGPLSLYFPKPLSTDCSWEELVWTPKLWQDIADDLTSDRLIDLRMRDATTLMLEGMALGTAVTAVVAAVIMGSR